MDDVPPLEAINRKEHSLFVFDDMITSSIKKQSRISEIFIRGRKLNISTAMISQSYYAVLPMIRRNSDYVIITRLNTLRDMSNIISEYGLDSSVED